MTRKRNPIGDEFDNDVIEEILRLADSIGDQLFLARQESDKLTEYVKAYDDGSWKFDFLADVPQAMYKMEKKFHNLARVVETFKDPE